MISILYPTCVADSSRWLAFTGVEVNDIFPKPETSVPMSGHSNTLAAHTENPRLQQECSHLSYIHLALTPSSTRQQRLGLRA